MSIVGGLDMHRKQITFDYLDTMTGALRRHGWHGASSRPGQLPTPAAAQARTSQRRPSRWRSLPPSSGRRSKGSTSTTATRPRPAGSTTRWPDRRRRRSGSRRAASPSGDRDSHTGNRACRAGTPKRMRQQQRRWRLHPGFWTDPRRPGTDDQRGDPRLDRLRRTLSRLGAGRGLPTPQRAPGAVGDAELQAAAPQLPAGAAVPGRRRTTRTRTVRPLGAGAAVRPMTRAG
jgi:hypothetical protein